MSHHCIILAGGIGTRLWPLSRQQRPKQFLDLFGTGRTLLQATLDRMRRIFPLDSIIVATCADQLDIVTEQLPEMPADNILAEPIRRGTLPAALWATTVIAERDPEACICCVPVDQLIVREHEFEADIRASLDFVARHHTPVTIGARPTRPDTFYGYIQAGDTVEGDDRFTRVKAFTEKPDTQFAQMFIDSGEFYWNTGINLWHAPTMLLALRDIDRDYSTMLLAERDQSSDPLSRVIERHFGTLPKMSLDLTIHHSLAPVHLRIGAFGWADMGNWHSMHDDLPTDRHGNVALHSEALLYDCSGNVVCMPRGTTLVMQDIHDKVVVEHDGILFIAPKDNYSEMRRVITDAQLKVRK